MLTEVFFRYASFYFLLFRSSVDFSQNQSKLCARYNRLAIIGLKAQSEHKRRSDEEASMEARRAVCPPGGDRGMVTATFRLPDEDGIAGDTVLSTKGICNSRGSGRGWNPRADTGC
jgi:hypothetical protein